MRFREIYKYTGLDQPKYAANLEWVTAYPIKKEYTPIHDYLIGIEIEAEGFNIASYQRMFSYAHSAYYWTTKEDRSLRGQGIELCSRVLSGLDVAMALGFLERINETVHPEYNDRTGTHVHLNVRDLSIEQWMSLYTNYILYEPALFQLSGNRTSSIYCVPLRMGEVPFSQLFREGLNEQERYERWCEIAPRGNKYLALNYAPVSKAGFGTVEFRHMVGTADLLWIKRWIDVIQRLRRSADKPIQKLLPEVFSLTEKNYKGYTEEIFGSLINPNIVEWDDFRSGLLMLKQWSVKQEEYEPYIEDKSIQKQKEKPLFTHHQREMRDVLDRVARNIRRVPPPLPLEPIPLIPPHQAFPGEIFLDNQGNRVEFNVWQGEDNVWNRGNNQG